jgi:hypothetical protein
MDNWTKYDYVCSDCDALMEITTRIKLKSWRGWCSCGSANLMMIGYADATVKVAPEYVTNITPSNVVKINSNPYTLY